MSKYLLNTMYLKPVFGRDKVKNKSIMMRKDAIILTIKDLDANTSRLQIIEEPKIDFYVTKDNDYTYPMESISIDKVDKITCKYRERSSKQAQAIGLSTQFYDSCRQGYAVKAMFEQNMLYNSPRLYMADMNIEDYYINLFQDKYGRENFMDNPVLKMGFADIEVDQFGYKGPKATGQNPAVPINLITYYNKFTNILHIYALDNQPKNEKIKELKDKSVFNLKIVEKIKKLIPEKYHDILYEIEFFAYEEDVIKAFFRQTHLDKPDFIGWWNINFDIPYIIGRLKILGVDVAEVMCHPDIPKEYREVYYIEDSGRKRDFNNSDSNDHPSRLWDWPMIPGYTQHYDMMSLYSNSRKRFILESYSLDAIGNLETGHTKVDYRSYGYNIRNLAHQSYETFVIYGAVDTILLNMIEDSTEDCSRYIIFTDNCRLSKGVGVSYTIYNLFYRWFKDKNEVIGNKVHYNIKEKLPGAIVANPENLRKHSILMRRHCVDYDEKALYPMIIITFNISKSTIHGRTYAIYNEEDGLYVEEINIKQLNPMLQTLDTSLFDLTTLYFELPTLDDILIDIEDRVDKAILRKKVINS